MAQACLEIQTANDFLTTNTNVVRRDIAKHLSLTAPWMDAIETDVWYANTSEVQRSVVQQNACSNDPNDMSFPTWENWSCDFNPQLLTIDTCEYQYRVQYRDYQGPTFCVATDHHSFRNSILRAEGALRSVTFDRWNARNRQQALLLAGTRLTISSTVSFNQALARGFQTNFVAGLCPDGPLTWQALQRLKNFMKNNLLATPENMWRVGGEMVFKFIGSDEIIDALRDEAGDAGINQNLRFLAAGGFKEGKEGLLAFQWEGPYRGVAFAVDQTPIRLNACNADGSVNTTNIVPPFVCAVGANGENIRAVNPKWEQAPYELGFLIGRKAIYRDIPEQFLGEGITKFDKQFWGGEIMWINNKDQTCNPVGDRGYHLLRFASAYRPVYPQFIVPILYGRCVANMGVTPCTLGYYTEGEVFTC